MAQPSHSSRSKTRAAAQPSSLRAPSAAHPSSCSSSGGPAATFDFMMHVPSPALGILPLASPVVAASACTCLAPPSPAVATSPLANPPISQQPPEESTVIPSSAVVADPLQQYPHPAPERRTVAFNYLDEIPSSVITISAASDQPPSSLPVVGRPSSGMGQHFVDFIPASQRVLTVLLPHDLTNVSPYLS